MNFTDNTFSRYDLTLHTITVTRCSPDMAVQTLQPAQQRPTCANAVSDHINSADTLSVSELKTLLVLLVISGPTPPPPPQHC